MQKLPRARLYNSIRLALLINIAVAPVVFANDDGPFRPAITNAPPNSLESLLPRDRFKPFNDDLARLLKRDLSIWN